MIKKKKEEEGNIWDFLIGLGLGIVGTTILAELIKPNCPVCNKKIEKGIAICPFCNTPLEWKAN